MKTDIHWDFKQIDSFVINGNRIDNKVLRLYKAKVFSDIPKSWKSLCLTTRPHNQFESGTLRIYLAKDKTLRYSTYVDGCFYEQGGRLEILNEDGTICKV